MYSSILLTPLFIGTFASPIRLEVRQSCPNVHVFGARETTASPGYGSAGTIVDAILNAHPGATSEAIDYPASGSDPTYSESVRAGTTAVVDQVRSFAQQCPDTRLVLVGYSQGGSLAYDNQMQD